MRPDAGHLQVRTQQISVWEGPRSPPTYQALIRFSQTDLEGAKAKNFHGTEERGVGTEGGLPRKEAEPLKSRWE